MTLDLSTLQIPPADVVPEPTAEEWERLKNQIGFLPWKAESFEARILCGTLRRCRELESDAREIREGDAPEHKCCKRCGTGPLIFSARQFADGLCHPCGHKRAAELEAEVERLKQTVMDYRR